MCKACIWLEVGNGFSAQCAYGGGAKKVVISWKPIHVSGQWGELDLDPTSAVFDPAILTHFMAKNCPKKVINGTTGHKQTWQLQTGDDEENVRTPPKLGRYWEIHPLCPRDFPRPLRSLGSR